MDVIVTMSLSVIVTVILVIRLPITVTELREYCFPNAFNVSCGAEAVIVLRSARYGRMSKGRCLTSDYKTDCFADVLIQVDRKCSGRHHCLISIPDNMLHQLQPCPKDLLAYLETDYICQKVEMRTAVSSCRYYGDLMVDGRSLGFLANIVTEELGLGSVRCPWVLSVPRGQRINLTLIDFGVAYRFDDVGNMCHVYAKVSETPMTSEMTICGSGTRERSVYVTETNRLEVTIMNLKLDEEPVYFLLRFEAIGCTDPWVPRGAWMRRTGEKAVIACNYTSQTWHIVCQGSHWYGRIDNCSSVFSQTAKQSTLSSGSRERFPYGLPVAVVTGLVVGVLLGIAMLAVVIACFKRWVTPHPILSGKLPESDGHGIFCGGISAAGALTPFHPTGHLGGEDKMTDGHLCSSSSNNAYDYRHLFDRRLATAAAAAAAERSSTCHVTSVSSSNVDYDVTDPGRGDVIPTAPGVTFEGRVATCRCVMERGTEGGAGSGGNGCCCCRHGIEPATFDHPDITSYWQGDSV